MLDIIDLYRFSLVAIRSFSLAIRIVASLSTNLIYISLFYKSFIESVIDLD